MPRPWKRKAFIEDGELITLKRLIKHGSSYVLVIPMDYVRYRCKPDENDDCWVRVNWGYDTGKLTIEGYQGG